LPSRVLFLISRYIAGYIACNNYLECRFQRGKNRERNLDRIAQGDRQGDTGGSKVSPSTLGGVFSKTPPLPKFPYVTSPPQVVSRSPLLVDEILIDE